MPKECYPYQTQDVNTNFKTLVLVCQDVHQVVMDMCNYYEAHELDVVCLRNAVKFWKQDGMSRARAYDDAVLALIKATLQEVDSLPKDNGGL